MTREQEKERLYDTIRVARGLRPADLVLKGGAVADLFTGRVVEADVAIFGETIAGLGGYHGADVVDCRGEVILPGFIDAHLHLESSFLTPRAFAEAAVGHGTTAVVADPHEIANVAGRLGIEYLLAASRGLPVDFYYMAPSCVPASRLETSAAEISAEDIERLLGEDGLLGLAEVMDVRAVLAGEEQALRKILAARGRTIDGHCPLLSGTDLCAYRAAGITSDHEVAAVAEASEKLRLGFHLMLRCGSGAPTLHLLPSLLNAYSAEHISLASDDLSALDLVHKGHLDEALRQAVSLGVEPLQAVKMASLTPARRFGFADRGAVAPGYRADLVMVQDLETFRVGQVVKRGKLIFDKGRLRLPLPAPAPVPEALRFSVHAPRVTPQHFRVPAGEAEIDVIGLVPGQILSRRLRFPARAQNGRLAADPGRDLAKVAVIERHKGSGRIGLGFVHGFGLKRGAFGASFSHDAHNLVVVGADDGDIALVTNRLIAMSGGVAATCGESLSACLPLPIAGLLSPSGAHEVSTGLAAVEAVLRLLGVVIPRPVVALSFLTLPVVPEARVTDRGMIHVSSGEAALC